MNRKNVMIMIIYAGLSDMLPIISYQGITIAGNYDPNFCL